MHGRRAYEVVWQVEDRRVEGEREWVMQRQGLKSLFWAPATGSPCHAAWSEDTNGKPPPWNTHNKERDDSYDGVRFKHY